MSRPFYMEDIGSQTLFFLFLFLFLKKYIFSKRELDFDNEKVFNTTQYPLSFSTIFMNSFFSSFYFIIFYVQSQ